MPPDFAEHFTEEWLSAWNNHDLEAILSHYAQELEFKSPLIVERYNDPNGTITNKEKLREYFQFGLTKNPNLKFKLIERTIGVNALTLYYENARGGRTSEYFEFNEQGYVVKSYSCYS